MALRQEIFHSFTRRQPPHMFLSPEYWLGASAANKTVIHTIQVAKWLWGDRSALEWSKCCKQPNPLSKRDHDNIEFFYSSLFLSFGFWFCFLRVWQLTIRTIFHKGRLMQQQQHLEQDVLADFRPIFRRAADKSRGEIFPTIWYSSNTEVVSMLLAVTSKMVLVAEDPGLRYYLHHPSTHPNIQQQQM
jgi:hypothetical protein